MYFSNESNCAVVSWNSWTVLNGRIFMPPFAFAAPRTANGCLLHAHTAPLPPPPHTFTMATSFKLYVAEGGSPDAEKIRLMLSFLGQEWEEAPTSADDLAAKSMTTTANPDDVVLKIGSLPALEIGDAMIEGSQNIMRYLGEHVDTVASRKAVTRKVDAIAEYSAGVLTQLTANEFAAESMTAALTQMEIILKHNLEEGTDFAPIAPSAFTYGDMTMFQCINAMVKAKGGMKIRPFNTVKEFHDTTAQFDSLEKYILARDA